MCNGRGDANLFIGSGVLEHQVFTTKVVAAPKGQRRKMAQRRTLSVAVAGLLAQAASGLYADEVGKLDWHRQHLGRFASAAFDGRGGITVLGEVRFWDEVERRGVFFVCRCCGDVVYRRQQLRSSTPKARKCLCFWCVDASHVLTSTVESMTNLLARASMDQTETYFVEWCIQSCSHRGGYVRVGRSAAPSRSTVSLGSRDDCCMYVSIFRVIYMYLQWELPFVSFA